MLKLPLTRVKNSNGTEFANHWTCRTEAGDHVFISYSDGKLILEMGSPSIRYFPDKDGDLVKRNIVHEWKPFCFFVLNTNSDFLTTAFLKLYLMREGLIEVVQWKFLLHKLIFPIVNLIELRKIKYECSLLD